jgi:hypothetical protein
MLTLCHFLPCACTNTIGATNTVPPIQWHNCIALVGCKEKGSVSSSITNHQIMPNNLAGNERKQHYVFLLQNWRPKQQQQKTLITMVQGINFSFATFLTPLFSLVTTLRYAMGH